MLYIIYWPIPVEVLVRLKYPMWEIAAHSAYDMFSEYKYLTAGAYRDYRLLLTVNIVFFSPLFSEWEFLSDCAIS